MRHAHVAALALHERVGCQGVVRTAVSRMRPRMSHPGITIRGLYQIKAKKEKPSRFW